jgi:hypothetical protein
MHSIIQTNQNGAIWSCSFVIFCLPRSILSHEATFPQSFFFFNYLRFNLKCWNSSLVLILNSSRVFQWKFPGKKQIHSCNSCAFLGCLCVCVCVNYNVGKFLLYGVTKKKKHCWIEVVSLKWRWRPEIKYKLILCRRGDAIINYIPG